MGQKRFFFPSVVVPLLFLSLLLSCIPDGIKQNKNALTREEKSWLKEHPNITLGIGESWEPFVYVGSEGQLSGYDVDLLNMINRKTGAHIKLVAGPWAELVEKSFQREIDGLAESGAVPSRERDFLFSDVYNHTEYTAVTTPEKARYFQGIYSFSEKRVAHLKGNLWTDKIASSLPDITDVGADSEIQAFSLVMENRADFALVPVHQIARLKDIYHQSLVVVYIFSGEEYILESVYSIRKDWPELQSIINKGLASLSPKQKV